MESYGTATHNDVDYMNVLNQNSSDHTSEPEMSFTQATARLVWNVRKGSEISGHGVEEHK